MKWENPEVVVVELNETEAQRQLGADHDEVQYDTNVKINGELVHTKMWGTLSK